MKPLDNTLPVLAFTTEGSDRFIDSTRSKDVLAAEDLEASESLGRRLCLFIEGGIDVGRARVLPESEAAVCTWGGTEEGRGSKESDFMMSFGCL